ncbi:hypothetical protein P153DRAFT_183354 [Dothidotthia symphoricarpi CBS 119687]|uniref:Uncharacterized protein n=1 Tax=Dothidotthia symphoricarpi CBS 119687 TaxID=1392245 RepID=A0A6A6ALS8_9PLEO|nr:uncharacterized protein P153DRAFT_183354 [Dothidotthia symphoricarpi CBS 119687]KAF2132035.1 hypothetical protein P153DRAFT_183354 [Dothidotthia symphoricarpi CBS 119687]
MCNGHSTRVSQGGSIAVLRPSPQTNHLTSDDEMLLFFTNQFAYPGTSVEFQCSKESFEQDRCWVVIHRDGDLSASSQQTQSNPLYSFSLDSDFDSSMQLPERLDLGVGDVGIIGRRVSVMASSTKGPLTVAEGIIGWN